MNSLKCYTVSGHENSPQSRLSKLAAVDEKIDKVDILLFAQNVSFN